MENQADKTQAEKTGSGFNVFAAKRIIIAGLLIIAVVWALNKGLSYFDRPATTPAAEETQQAQVAQENGHDMSSLSATASMADQALNAASTNEHSLASPSRESDQSVATGNQSEHAEEEAGYTKAGSSATVEAKQAQPVSKTPQNNSAVTVQQEKHMATGEAQPAVPQEQRAVRPKGVAFVEAVTQPIDYELNKRFWGWRPNDIINFTDNINNFQLGVLEVTRRSTVMLSERISRTGSTDRLNPHLEDAANWLMVTATRYWFPSPESKYEECIKELEAYKQELMKGSASFYIRADNLIPLLASYEDLLGSCDENLVKQKNEDGSSVSVFKADDFFFYAKGVASAMATILEAIDHDFLPTLENRHGTELLHHALISCRQAAAISPLLITDADLDGIFANHRANMAAPISHARYYIGQLIKTLST